MIHTITETLNKYNDIEQSIRACLAFLLEELSAKSPPLNQETLKLKSNVEIDILTYTSDDLKVIYPSEEDTKKTNSLKIFKSNGTSPKRLDLAVKTGVYIFLDAKTPVYIGVGGKQKNDKTDWALYDRLRQQFNNKRANYTTFINNIACIDKLLNTDINDTEHAIKKRKMFNLMVITTGDKANSASKDLATILETVLIALFHPMYNK